MVEVTEAGCRACSAIAWGMEVAPPRDRSGELSHEAIVDAAVELADAGGLGAVTMAKVAEALGFTTMSLYRYVSSKDELILLMQDAVLREPEVLPRRRRRLAYRAAGLRHHPARALRAATPGCSTCRCP